MPVIVSLLRAVNLGPYNKVKMETLREVLGELGCANVQTYVQSGNAVFKTSAKDVPRIDKKIEAAIEEHFGVVTTVVVRTPAELQSVIARNPFAKRKGIEPAKLNVFFLAGEPAPEAREKIAQVKVGGEELRLDGRELYTYYPDGMGRSKLTSGLIERTLKVTGTARNWNTVLKLLEMAEALG